MQKLSLDKRFGNFTGTYNEWNEYDISVSEKKFYSQFILKGCISHFSTFPKYFFRPLEGPWTTLQVFKGCVHYIFVSLFCMSKRGYLWNKEKCFLFLFESSFCSWDNQILTFQVFKCHDVIKCLSMKHEAHITE